VTTTASDPAPWSLGGPPNDIDIERFDDAVLNDVFEDTLGDLTVARDRYPLRQIMRGAPPAPPEMLVPKLVLAGDVNLWAGNGGVGKSTALLHLAVCVVIGRPIFGTLRPTRAGRVILLLPEDGGAVARSILDAIVATMGLSDVERGLLEEELFVFEDDSVVNLTTDAKYIGALAQDLDAALVIIDPLRDVLGGEDEIDPSVAHSACDRLRRLVCRPTGAAVILAHHLRKPANGAPEGEVSASDVRGSGGWVNHSRVVFMFTKKNGSDRITMTCVKGNRIKTGTKHELTLRIEADPHNEAHWLTCQLLDANMGAMTSVSLTAGLGRPLDRNELAALEALDDTHEPGKRLSTTDWVDTSGLNRNTLLKGTEGVKGRLLKAGLAQAHEVGEHRNGGKLYAYSITEKGRAALASLWVHNA
jgi:hypothetical protein